MGRCSWEITKGSKKGETCGIYTKKKYEGEYYCASHFKMIEELNKEEIEEEVEEEEEIKVKKITKPKITSGSKSNKKKPQKKIETVTLEDADLEEPTLDTHSLEEIIEHDFKKAINKDKSKSDIQRLTDKISHLYNRLNEIFPPDRMFEKSNNTNLIEDHEMPPFERFN